MVPSRENFGDNTSAPITPPHVFTVSELIKLDKVLIEMKNNLEQNFSSTCKN